MLIAWSQCLHGLDRLNHLASCILLRILGTVKIHVFLLLLLLLPAGFSQILIL